MFDWLRTGNGGSQDYPPPPPVPQEHHNVSSRPPSQSQSQSRLAGVGAQIASTRSPPPRDSTSDTRRKQMDDDEAIARSMAQAEQEAEDARLARQFAERESQANNRGMGRGGTMHQQATIVQMRCGACFNAVNVQVPPAANSVGSTIRASCPRCSSVNDFKIPAPAAVPTTSWPSSMPGNYAPSEFLDDDLIHVACEIGGIAIEMMVDTGAQSSVISRSLAQRLNLLSRLDSSRQGVATGVGTARILGQLHRIPVKIGLTEFDLDFTVLGVEEQLLMLGIDQMKRFKCILDLERKCIVFGGSGGVEVPFLPSSPSRGLSLRNGCPQM